MLTVKAPAKINLTLEVLGKRPDGYHEIRSVIQAIGLYDTLHFAKAESTEIRSSETGWVAEQSIIPKAVRLMKAISGYSGGVSIEIEKRIPLMAGLGGDSSNAVAVLRALNELWGLFFSQGKLLELAPQLGSDVTFFIHGGTALMSGRGEKITLLPAFPHHYIILVKPAIPQSPGKTALAYASLKPSFFTDGSVTERLVTDMKSGNEFTPDHLFNTFENVFFARGSEILNYYNHMKAIGAPFVHLAGSGPALFTILKDRVKAEDLYLRLKNYGMETYLAETTE